MQDWIFQGYFVRCVQINAIGFRGDRDLAVLNLLPMRVGLIEIVNRVQTQQSRVFDIPHSMVGMQSLFKAQWCFSRIRYHKLKVEFEAKGNAMDQAKFDGPASFRILVAFGEHADCDRAPNLRDRLQSPRFGAYESVRRRIGIVRLASKPGETDRYAPTNCVAVFPFRLCANKEHPKRRRTDSYAPKRGDWSRSRTLKLPRIVSLRRSQRQDFRM